MGRVVKEEKSDDIEIVSIGRLYTGPWDKKYWSSSRGKDRYPYPVGYKSLRTQNGFTYTMEILEGHKGPSFMISSTDGKSCSGGTPDIAWESFQKKGCSKLWHGKRFSCKIDGVEFFGFKNTFVQRLLRELVANDGRTAEQSLPSLNFSNGAFPSVDQLQSKVSNPESDRLKLLSKAQVTGKRSRKDKIFSSKQVNGTNCKHQQEKCIKIVTVSNSKQREESISGSGDPSTFAAVSGFNNSPGILGPENLAAVVGDENHLPVAERSAQLDSLCMSHHLNIGRASQGERELTSSLNNFGTIVDNLLQKEEPSDRQRDAGECINLVPQERGGVTNVEDDLPVVNDVDLCAPDTLEFAADSLSISSAGKDMPVHLTVKDATTNDVAKSEVLETEPPLSDEMGKSGYNSSSEKCDTDSVGEIAKSMMTVLLPRALPLLKKYTRKKRKGVKPSKIHINESQDGYKLPAFSMTDATIERAEHSYLERKNEETVIPCTNSAVLASGNSNSVALDSFDNDDLQDLFIRADAAEADQVLCSLNHSVQLPTNVNAESNPMLCGSSVRKQDMDLQYEGVAIIKEMPKKDLGTSDVMSGTTADIQAPAKDISANLKSDRVESHFMDNISSDNALFLEATSRSKCIMGRSSSDIFIPENSEVGFGKLHKDTKFADCDNPSSKMQIPSASCSTSMIGNEMKDDSTSSDQQNLKLYSNLTCFPRFFACYVHPLPVSMVQLIVKDNAVFICAKCEYSEQQRESTLFVYKAIKTGEKMGCPSLIGHTPIALQSSNNILGGDNVVERSFLQLTPDAQSIVLANNIRTPYCREGRIHCSCPACSSACPDNSAIKIVKLNSGYASLVTRLETTQSVCCLLICEPSLLLAAEEGGKLRLWVMNCEWSGQVEARYLPAIDCMFPNIVELKRIPRSGGLVVGHNGFGNFALWDIEKHNMVARFSSPGMSVRECIPASIFRWQRKGEHNMEVLMDEIMNATKTWNSRINQSHDFSAEDKDLAVWLLISTVPDPNSQCCPTCEQETSCWQLALLINNKVITGSAVYGSAATVTSTGHGIIGTCDGSVYVWELTTGAKLEILHSFNGGRVSCIAPDASSSGAMAIASGGQLLLYLSS